MLRAFILLSVLLLPVLALAADAHRTEPYTRDELSKMSQAQLVDLTLALQAQSSELRQQLASLQPTPAPGSASAPGNTTAPGSVPNAGSSAATADTPWTYTYEYEYGLIKNKDKGKITLRFKDGTRSKVRYSFDEYRKDAVWVACRVTNTSKTPFRFNGTLALAGKLQKKTDKTVPILSSTVIDTRILQPGETQQIDLEMPVPDPSLIHFIELGRVVGLTE